MSGTVINIEGSKQLLAHLFEMEIGKITESIRRESSDDKDSLIMKLEQEIELLKSENRKVFSVVEELRKVITR